MKKLLSILFIILSVTAYGQNDALFNKATVAYNEGDFNTAIEHYQEIVAQGQHSAAIYFNLGNCYYKLNQIAPSIYNYEKALLLKPNDVEIKNNLSYAQNMTLDAIEAIPETSFSKVYNDVIYFISFDQWAYLAVLFVFIFIILYLIFYFSRYATNKRIAFISSVTSAFVAIVAFIFALLQYNNYESKNPAIVFDDEVRIKAEPNNSSSEIFRLHEGTKLNVIAKLNEWRKIKIADGQTGWLNTESIKLLRDFNNK